MYLIGVVIYLAGILCAMVFKHLSFTVFLNPTAIILQVGAILSVLISTRSFAVFGNGFKAALFPKSDVPEEMRGRAASLFRLLSKVCAFAMFAGMSISLISMFGDLNDIEALGMGIASTLTSPLCGLMLIAVIFEPAVFILKKRPETNGRHGRR